MLLKVKAGAELCQHQGIPHITAFCSAAARRAAPTSMTILCESVNLCVCVWCEIISWPLIGRKSVTSLSWAMPHLGQLNQIRLTEDDLQQKTTFDGGWSLTEDNLWQKGIRDGRRLLTQDNFWWKTTLDRVYSILPEKHVFDSTPWQPQHNWPQTGNPISCPNRK